MAIYAVHCRAGEADQAAALERARLVKLGFAWAAFLFGPLWALGHRLWRPLTAFIVGSALLGYLMTIGAIGAGAAVSLYILFALYLGIEGRALLEAELARRGQPLADIVCAADRSTAERAFFERGLQQAPPRSAPPSARPPQGAPPPPPQVLGLFPEAHR
ncbi:MAG TPA: DUF2628 domain-containing protein [Roseiarcus sp.]|jgi:hypothetical protein